MWFRSSLQTVRCSKRLWHRTMTTKGVNAGIIIIGDEILKGQVLDTNTHFLTQNLRKLGVKVDRVSVIPDDIDIIADEVSSFSKRFTYVLTSGGIGPTHDDMTFEGVAKAFGDEVAPHPDIVKFCKEWFKTDDLNSPVMKLAVVPTTAKLNYGFDKERGVMSRFPLISVNNVYVFPGIPDLLRRGFRILGRQLFFNPEVSFHVHECFLDDHEISITPRLNDIVARFPDVTFGSYPTWVHSYYKVKLTIESVNAEKSREAMEEIKKQMPVIQYDSEPLNNAYEKMAKLCEEDELVKSVWDEALEAVKKCFSDYSPEEVAVCFNGGKDCIVMLHIVYGYLAKEFPNSKLHGLYIREADPFPEVVGFVDEAIKMYNIDMVTTSGSMKQALKDYLIQRPEMKAMFLGTRNGDPGSSYMSAFCLTDGDWPRIMRVNPILHWNYQHVWTFIRRLSLPYPSLYDQGYTSLGHRSNTHPNPNLKVADGDGKEKYLPAYELKDGSLERNGRY